MAYPQTHKTVLWDERNMLGVTGNPVVISPDGVVVQPVSIVGEPGGSTLTTSQVSVGATATLLVAANANRKGLAIVNHGTTDVFFGQTSGVTTSTGALLAGVKGNAVSVDITAAVYAIVASGTQTVSVAEIS